MRLLVIALALAVAAPPITAFTSPQDAAASFNSAASNATLGALATLLAGKGYANDSCPLIKDARIAAEAAIVSDKLAAIVSSAAPKLCATLEALTPAAFCPVAGFLERALTTCTSFPGSCDTVPACANATGTGNQVAPPTVAASGAPPPATLTDERPLKPWPFKRTILETEGATYYWVYRNVQNMYSYYPCASNPASAFLVPTGWTQVAMASLTQVKPDGSVLAPPQPFAVVLFNPTTSTLAISMRGTATKTEWLTDFEYSMVKPDGLDIPGLVHSGFLRSYKEIAPTITAALTQFILSPPPGGPVATSVLFGGHSMGSGVAQIAALDAAATLGNAGSNVVVSAVLLAPPSVGNDIFAAAFNTAVNGRAVAFVYDPVPQVPCKGFYGCGAKQVPAPTGVVDGVPPWPYSPGVGGRVELTPVSMGPQAEYWGGLDRINLCYMLQQLGGECGR